MSMPYSRGTPVVSASIKVGVADPVEVAKDATITDLTIARPGYEDEVIASSKVVGFKLGNLEKPGFQDTVYDGVPTYRQDPTGGAFLGMAEEVLRVSDIVVEITVGTETELRVVPVELIKALTVA